MEKYLGHYSVLLKECLDALKMGVNNSNENLFADLTFGAGGHTFAISDQIQHSKVISTDQDPDALENGEKVIVERQKQNQISLLNMNFSQFPDWAVSQGLSGKFSGILMDLGVSSHQFDKMDRGFSFRGDSILDMRMNYQSDEIPTAADLLNSLSETEIADLIYKYGEERLSRRIASSIVEFRKTKKIETTKELENICFHAYPAKERHGRIHPATRTFQALRIAVNSELKVLEDTLPKLLPLLCPGGVIAVISFHSLEDRIVKHKFKELMENQDFPVTILTKKPILPSETEVSENSRSRSAKLRILQRNVSPGRVDGIKKKKFIQV